MAVMRAAGGVRAGVNGGDSGGDSSVVFLQW